MPAEPPCERCTARCCRRQTSGWPFAIELVEADGTKFETFAVTDDTFGMRVIPYNEDGRCPYLAPDNRCRVHADKPISCRAFTCTSGHIVFLSRNPELVALLESSTPDAPA